MAGPRKKAVFILVSFLILSLIGCTQATPVVTSPALAATIPPTAAATSTPIPSTKTPIPTFTPARSPTISIATPASVNGNVGVKCLDGLDTLPEGRLGQGVLVVDTFGSRYSLWNMETGEKRSLEEDRNFTSRSASVSPNGSLLALEKFDANGHNQLWIMDANGQILQTLDGDYLQANNPAWAWLNDRQLIFNVTFLQPETAGQDTPQHFLVLEPFTGEQQTLAAEFPNIFDWTGPATEWDAPWNQSHVAYNSSLTHAVYLGEKTLKYSLWDLARGKEVASLLSLQDHSGPPRWSPDGSRFLMLGFKGDPANLPAQFDYQLYLVDTQGRMTSLDQGQKWSYDGYFWSPSGRSIALFLYQENGTDRLALFDTQTKKFTDTCLSFTPDRSFVTLAPVWSPDETQLILQDQVARPEGGFLSRLILVDLVKETAVQLTQDSQAKGWMTNPH